MNQAFIAWLNIDSFPLIAISRFSIMFYAITKKIIQGAVSFIIMVIAFGFAFFVISYDSEEWEEYSKNKAEY